MTGQRTFCCVNLSRCTYSEPCFMQRVTCGTDAQHDFHVELVLKVHVAESTVNSHPVAPRSTFADIGLVCFHTDMINMLERSSSRHAAPVPTDASCSKQHIGTFFPITLHPFRAMLHADSDVLERSFPHGSFLNAHKCTMQTARFPHSRHVLTHDERTF